MYIKEKYTTFFWHFFKEIIIKYLNDKIYNKTNITVIYMLQEVIISTMLTKQHIIIIIIIAYTTMYLIICNLLFKKIYQYIYINFSYKLKATMTLKEIF